VNLVLGHTFAAMTGHPSFERIDLEDAGHCANLDVPDEMRRVLDDFWRRAGAAPVAADGYRSADSLRPSAT